jgi:hypothetical protein
MQTLQECLALAEYPKMGDMGDIEEKIGLIDKKIVEAEVYRKTLFGFENLAINGIAQQVGELEKQKVKLRNQINYNGLPKLSLEPLKWRDKNGWPRLALFGLESPVCSLRVEGYWSDKWFRSEWKPYSKIYSGMPTELLQYYDDVKQKLYDLCAQHKADVTLRCSYSGVFPLSTRHKIHDNMDKFKRLYLLTEATDWQVVMTEKPKPTLELADPLLVGWDGESLWLIDHFELTPIERLIAAEFTV